MLNRFMNLLLIIIISSSVLFISCNKKDEITSPVQNTEKTIAFTNEEITSQAQKIVTGVINNSIISYVGFNKIYSESVSEYTLSKSGQPNKTNVKTKDGYYIWDFSFTDPDWPNAFSGTFYCKVQFRGANGLPVKDPRTAESAYIYLKITAAFGFTDGSTYGDKTLHQMEGIWSDLQGTPTFNGSGLYERNWRGLYNGDEANIHYLATINVDQLKLSLENGAVNTTGNIGVTVDDYNASGACNGSSMVHLTVYKGDETCNTRDIDISKQLSQISFLLEMMN